MSLCAGWAVSAFFGYLKGVNNELALKHVPEVLPRNDSLAGPVGRRGDQVQHARLNACPATTTTTDAHMYRRNSFHCKSKATELSVRRRRSGASQFSGTRTSAVCCPCGSSTQRM